MNDRLFTIDEIMLRLQLACNDLDEYVHWCNLDVWDWVAFWEKVDHRLHYDPTPEEVEEVLNEGTDGEEA